MPVLVLLNDGSFVVSLALLLSEELSVKPIDMLPVDGETRTRMRTLTCGGAWRYRLAKMIGLVSCMGHGPNPCWVALAWTITSFDLS